MNRLECVFGSKKKKIFLPVNQLVKEYQVNTLYKLLSFRFMLLQETYRVDIKYRITL